MKSLHNLIPGRSIRVRCAGALLAIASCVPMGCDTAPSGYPGLGSEAEQVAAQAEVDAYFAARDQWAIRATSRTAPGPPDDDRVGRPADVEVARSASFNATPRVNGALSAVVADEAVATSLAQKNEPAEQALAAQPWTPLCGDEAESAACPEELPDVAAATAEPPATANSASVPAVEANLERSVLAKRSVDDAVEAVVADNSEVDQPKVTARITGVTPIDVTPIAAPKEPTLPTLPMLATLPQTIAPAETERTAKGSEILNPFFALSGAARSDPATDEAPAQSITSTSAAGYDLTGRSGGDGWKRQLDAARDLASQGKAAEAQSRLISLLREIAGSNDRRENGTRRTDALETALSALNDAEEFAQKSVGVESSLDLEVIAATLPTMVDLEGVANRQEAAHRYRSLAREQFAAAIKGSTVEGSTIKGSTVEQATVEGTAVGSQILFTLGKTYGDSIRPRAEGAEHLWQRAVALQQASLLADERNHLAANELGVLYAHGGDFQGAAEMFARSITLRANPEAAHNLAALGRQLSQQRTAVAPQPTGNVSR